MKENDKLHDALERQSELIAALRNEIATKVEWTDHTFSQLCKEYNTTIGPIQRIVNKGKT